MSVDSVWIKNVPPVDSPYWRQVERKALELGSDGCTCVADWFIDACYEHDIHWRTGKTIYGVPLTTRQANQRFRLVIQSREPRWKSWAIGWVRWVGVSIGGVFLQHQTT